MNHNAKRNLVIGLCSIGGMVAVAGIAAVVLLASTKRVLANLEFSELFIETK